ncbi:putative motor protein [Coniochaeta sp. 2T2.1]|nr:putative motor protein [Coniochaeta sp. 2T2.1]
MAATANANRFSSYTNASTGAESKNGEQKKDMWSTLLDSVASGKRLLEKNLLVLGGTVDSQRDFLESLSNQDQRRIVDKTNTKLPPVANNFALGYTYYDVLDADQEDILARISMYTLTSPSPAFSSLIQPLLTPQSIPNTLIVILLDWSQPWKWMRQLRQWILLLRTVLVSLSNESKETMEEVMLSWRDRGRQGGTNLDGSGAAATSEGDVALPLGPGEWEDALALPLCVVCQNAEQMEVLEKTQGWKEEEFDVVLQFMRTILLKHGASLIYTTPTMSSQLQSLVHASLGIHSLLKKNPLKHNVIDREKILVPPNWDSWGKIRVLREGFDMELVSNGWSVDLDQPLPNPTSNGLEKETITNGDSHTETEGDSSDPEGSTVVLYESSVQDPAMDALALASQNSHSTKLEVETTDTQVFLAEQLGYLEKLKQQRDAAAKEDRSKGGGARKVDDGESGVYTNGRGGAGGEGRVNEHIGPVQFNMGGIQVDADDMVQRLKDRQTFGASPEPESPPPESRAAIDANMDPENMDSEKMQEFFNSLMQKGGR